MSEVWKQIPGYMGRYEISSCGNVRSTDRLVKQVSSHGSTIVRRLKGCMIAPADNGHGYLYVSLRDGNQKKNHYVHRLVAEAFVPNLHGYKTVNHIDFNRKNNKALNLEWLPQSDNVVYSKANMQHEHNSRLPQSGQKYISWKDGKWRFSIKKKGLRYEKRFDTIEEAIIERERFIDEQKHNAN